MDYTYRYFTDAFEQARKTAENLISDLDAEIFLRRPAEDKWSIGEILSHLVQAGNQYLTQIQKRLDEPDAKLITGGPPFSPNLLVRWFIRQNSPQNKRPLPTVPSFKPHKTVDLDQQEVLNNFLQLQYEFLLILKKAKLLGLDLDRIKTRNPVIKVMPMSLTACLGVTEAHQRRHFEQMRALKEKFADKN